MTFKIYYGMSSVYTERIKTITLYREHYFLNYLKLLKGGLRPPCSETQSVVCLSVLLFPSFPPFLMFYFISVMIN